MPRIFIVVCPKCQGRYPCHFDELRHKDIKLICPYCEHVFSQEESPSIEE